MSPLAFVQAFRDYGSSYQAAMSRAGTQIGGVIATDYMLKEQLYGILLAPTMSSPKARLHTILGKEAHMQPSSSCSYTTHAEPITVPWECIISRG